MKEKKGKGEREEKGEGRAKGEVGEGESGKRGGQEKRNYLVTLFISINTCINTRKRTCCRPWFFRAMIKLYFSEYPSTN